MVIRLMSLVFFISDWQGQIIFNEENQPTIKSVKEMNPMKPNKTRPRLLIRSSPAKSHPHNCIIRERTKKHAC